MDFTEHVQEISTQGTYVKIATDSPTLIKIISAHVMEEVVKQCLFKLARKGEGEGRDNGSRHQTTLHADRKPKQGSKRSWRSLLSRAKSN